MLRVFRNLINNLDLLKAGKNLKNEMRRSDVQRSLLFLFLIDYLWVLIFIWCFLSVFMCSF